MRILRVHPFLKSETILPGAGGMARVSLQLTLALARAGHEVRVLPVPERLFQSYAWMLDVGQSVRVEPTLRLLTSKGLAKVAPRAIRLEPRPRNLREYLLNSMSLVALQEAVRSFSPDIVHNHLARRPFPRLARAAGLRRPMVLTHHHGEAGECLEEYSRVVFNSKATQVRIAEKSGLPLERTRVVYHPVAEIFLNGQVMPNQLRSGIAFLGAVRDRKGIDLLLQAYAAHSELRSHTLYCMGSGEALDRCRSFAQQLNLPVVFEGEQPPTRVRERLGSVLATVIPSRLEFLQPGCKRVPVLWDPGHRVGGSGARNRGVARRYPGPGLRCQGGIRRGPGGGHLGPSDERADLHRPQGETGTCRP